MVGEVFPQGPLGHLKKEGGRGVVFFEGVCGIEKSVGHEVTDVHEDEGFGNEFGILYGATPTEAVITFVECAFFVVKISSRCGGFGTSAGVAREGVEFLGTGFGVARVAPGNVHVLKLREAHAALFTGVGDAVFFTPFLNGFVVGVEKVFIL